jgi:hypothetical protein
MPWHDLGVDAHRRGLVAEAEEAVAEKKTV